MIRERLIVAAGLILAALVAWTFWPRQSPEVGKSEPLPPAKEVRTVEKIIERVKYVKVYPPSVKAKLGLPDAVVAAPEKRVIATGKLDAAERPYTLAAVLDTGTGESEVFAKPLPRPLAGPGEHGGIGLGYGYASGGPQIKVFAYQELLRVSALRAGARAEVDQRGEWWAGATLEYRW